jgi:hypothetical protein
LETFINDILTNNLSQTTIFSAVVWAVLSISLRIEKTSLKSIALLTAIVPIVAILLSTEHPVIITILTSLSVIGIYGILKKAEEDIKSLDNLVEMDRRSKKLTAETITEKEEQLEEKTNGHYTLKERTIVKTYTEEIEDDDKGEKQTPKT